MFDAELRMNKQTDFLPLRNSPLRLKIYYRITPSSTKAHNLLILIDSKYI